MKQYSTPLSLSVLIPRYNFEMNRLASDLLLQMDGLIIECELIVADDGSTCPIVWQKEIAEHPKFRYIPLSQNIGRSRIRNLLAEQARHELLLFLDCDSLIDPDFIFHYLDNATLTSIVAGGTRYEDVPPYDGQFHLHWQYGRKVETKALKESELFHSNNFMIGRELFLSVRFDEQVKGYGHEDTFFRITLQRLKVPILKIDNPVYHIGLNRASDFLQHTRNAVDNLLANPDYLPNHLVVRLHHLVRMLRINRPFRSIFHRFSPMMERSLSRKFPSITLFNIYKLLYILSR